MLRFILGLIGAAFAGVLLISGFNTVSTFLSSEPERSAEHEFHKHPKHLALASNGPFGKYDKAQLQRGFQVYKEVCAACHGLHQVAFRDLAALGYSENAIKKIASDWAIEVPSVNPETGEAATRKAIPSDRFPSPYANETAGRAANNNAYPPDLSLMTKAREGGAAYVYSLLTGYTNQQGYKNEKGQELLKEFPSAKTPEGLHFNPYFPNLNIAMPQPIVSDGQVTYAEGNPAPTVDQMAKDVSAFLVWTAEPKLENRHRIGIVTVLFLLVGSFLGYLAYREIWAEAKRKVRVTGPLEAENQAKSRAAKDESGIAG
ncbi:cytochrome c1 [Sphingomonas piscis]|uniref:Cytochrome c1 n=1 Tax=Sphingomonas piscis TaxID=2714943 RepID=A0A6G7YLW0_9SPHN|nr:cytochrome c1 [Sphingomonas piscis]QIK77729.1 cytochrome c1 [Sphingomonas piscis]